MNARPRRERLRAILSGRACVHPASVYDPASVRIAEDLGFEMGMFAGSIASLTVLGAPDIVVLTLSEFAEQAQRICRASTLPVLCDADHGYGNALNVMRTVEEMETAGIAGLTIEDTALPAVFDEPRASLLAVEEGVGKMKAALAARQDDSLVVVGRTSAMSVTNDDDALARIKAFEAAGVDAIFLAGVKTRAQIEKAAAAVKLPLILGSVPNNLMNREDLAALNVRICLQGHLPYAAAVQAVYDTMKALRDGTPMQDVKGAASAALMKAVSRGDAYTGWAKDYLKS
jgi:carboxyvinyl-carboxyphosphonate phosphorylmutase